MEIWPIEDGRKEECWWTSNCSSYTEEAAAGAAAAAAEHHWGDVSIGICWSSNDFLEQFFLSSMHAFAAFARGTSSVCVLDFFFIITIRVCFPSDHQFIRQCIEMITDDRAVLAQLFRFGNSCVNKCRHAMLGCIHALHCRVYSACARGCIVVQRIQGMHMHARMFLMSPTFCTACMRWWIHCRSEFAMHACSFACIVVQSLKCMPAWLLALPSRVCNTCMHTCRHEL